MDNKKILKQGAPQEDEEEERKDKEKSKIYLIQKGFFQYVKW